MFAGARVLARLYVARYGVSDALPADVYEPQFKRVPVEAPPAFAPARGAGRTRVVGRLDTCCAVELLASVIALRAIAHHTVEPCALSTFGYRWLWTRERLKWLAQQDAVKELAAPIDSCAVQKPEGVAPARATPNAVAERPDQGSASEDPASTPTATAARLLRVLEERLGVRGAYLFDEELLLFDSTSSLFRMHDAVQSRCCESGYGEAWLLDADVLAWLQPETVRRALQQLLAPRDSPSAGPSGEAPTEDLESCVNSVVGVCKSLIDDGFGAKFGLPDDFVGFRLLAELVLAQMDVSAVRKASKRENTAYFRCGGHLCIVGTREEFFHSSSAAWIAEVVHTHLKRLGAPRRARDITRVYSSKYAEHCSTVYGLPLPRGLPSSTEECVAVLGARLALAPTGPTDVELRECRGVAEWATKAMRHTMQWLQHDWVSVLAKTAGRAYAPMIRCAVLRHLVAVRATSTVALPTAELATIVMSSASDGSDWLRWLCVPLAVALLGSADSVAGGGYGPWLTHIVGRLRKPPAIERGKAIAVDRENALTLVEEAWRKTHRGSFSWEALSARVPMSPGNIGEWLCGRQPRPIVLRVLKLLFADAGMAVLDVPDMCVAVGDVATSVPDGSVSPAQPSTASSTAAAADAAATSETGARHLPQ